MNQTATVSKKVRSWFREAQRLASAGNTWPSKRRLQDASDARPNPRARADRLIELVGAGNRAKRFLAGLPREERRLFERYFVAGEKASLLARATRRPLWRVYEELNDLAARFLEEIDGKPTGPRREPGTGRFAPRAHGGANKR